MNLVDELRIIVDNDGIKNVLHALQTICEINCNAAQELDTDIGGYSSDQWSNFATWLVKPIQYV
jgi:hypothetical protein